MISTKTINDIPKENIINLLTFWNRKRQHGQTGNRGRRQSEKWRCGDIAEITETFNEQAEGIGIGVRLVTALRNLSFLTSKMWGLNSSR